MKYLDVKSHKVYLLDLLEILAQIVALSSSVSGMGIDDEELACLTTTSKHWLKGDGE